MTLHSRLWRAAVRLQWTRESCTEGLRCAKDLPAICGHDSDNASWHTLRTEKLQVATEAAATSLSAPLPHRLSSIVTSLHPAPPPHAVTKTHDMYLYDQFTIIGQRQIGRPASQPRGPARPGRRARYKCSARARAPLGAASEAAPSGGRRPAGGRRAPPGKTCSASE